MVDVAVNNVSVKLGSRLVVDGLSAEFKPGELVGVIGPNGAGKSTLVRAMLGLLPMVGGEVQIDSTPVSRIPARQLAQRIAYLPQGQTLHWPLSVERLVSLGRLPHLAPFSEVQQSDLDVIWQAMARTDTTHLAHRDAITLSGGERARVMLARALAVGADGLVADEPLAALDPGHQIDVMELLKKEADGGAMVIAVLHDLTLAARYCSRLLLIDEGRLVANGAPVDVLTPERLADVYGIRAMLETNGGAPLVVPLGRTRATPTI